MNGVILYADDDVLNVNSFENSLFSKFNNQQDYSVLPITNIRDLETTVKSVSTIRALLLDWEFKRPKEDDDLPDVNENPLDFLKRQKIYSLIYIYSRTEIPNDVKAELKNIYGENKVFFTLKSSEADEDSEYHKITSGIADFEQKNNHMEIPFLWSQSINQSVQSIFSELESADPNWIKEIRDTSKNDGGEPTSEVIDIFHNLVSESIIQDKTLRDALDSYDNNANMNTSAENTAKLYQRIFYTKITEGSPIMTGDIFKFTDNEYGILITPECEIGKRKDSQLEFLIIKKEDFDKFLKEVHSFERTNDNYNNLSNGKKEKLRKIFNNDSLSIQILPSFPFNENKFNQAAYIIFKTAFSIKNKVEFDGKRTSFKLNSPYIHQLRQRFVAFFGRYGVPAIPDSLRHYSLT